MQHTDGRTYGATAIVITNGGRLLLQQRDDMDAIARFGGGGEANETTFENLRRELAEELGAEVQESDVIKLTEIEGANLHTGVPILDTVYVWRDSQNSITGVYEGQAVYFSDAASALANVKLTKNTRITIELALEKGLIA